MYIFLFYLSIKVESELHDSDFNEDSVSVDALYSINIYENDVIPNIAVGGIPAGNAEDMTTVIDKIVRFENLMDYVNHNAVILVDKKDGMLFQSMADILSNSFISEEINVEIVSAYRDTNIEKVRNEFLEKLNSNPIFVSYFGYGNPAIWSHDTLFYFENVSEVKNYSSPFILTSLPQSFNYDLPANSTISRALLLSEYGGAVACIGTYGLNYANFSNEFISSLWKNVLYRIIHESGTVYWQYKNRILITIN